MALFVSFCFHESVPHSSDVLEQADENRPRHERRSSREDLDVRRSSDPPGRQAPSYDQPPARRAPGGPAGEGFTHSLKNVYIYVCIYVFRVYI